MLTAVLQEIDHRPWPLPPGQWFMAQRWTELLFAHWPVRLESLRPHVPDHLEIETFDGAAWIGVVPFRMENVHFKGSPVLPWLSKFPELNVRTYVTFEDRPGVWFFSLDASNRLAVAVARRWFFLPYFRAEMSIEEDDGNFAYRSFRTHPHAPPADFEATYRSVGEVYRSKRGDLDHWLTERYCLYSRRPDGALYRAEVHHRSWPLQAAQAEIRHNTMTESLAIELPQDPLLHFARSLDVATWPALKVSR